MKKISKFLIVIFMLFALGGNSFTVNAQGSSKMKLDKFGNVRYIKFDGKNKTGKWETPSSPDGFFKDVLGAREQDKFIVKNKIERKDGSYYEHYRQFYNGIEVEDGLFILQFNNGKLAKASGHYVNTAGVDSSPALTSEDAAKSYAGYLNIPATPAPPKFLHGITIAEIETISGTDTTYNTKLCYKIDLLDSLANGETGYIDAHTGKVLKTQRNWNDYSATGTFATLYSGTENAGTQFFSNTYNLIDSSRNAVINTWDINNTYYEYYASNAVEFTDNDNNWTAAEHSASHDQMALDIHWAMEEIYDYFDTNHSLQSFDGNNHMIDAFVHAVFEGGDKDNAKFAWFPNGDQAFFFGDGQTTFKPLGALDVVAHEYAHGITHNFTGLTIDYGVQSAMNEGLSDIWGAIVEHAVAPNKDLWKIGEEVINVSGDDCLRNIQEPESSTANTQIADTYGDNVYTTGNYYAKSGVMSHWFYLLAEGGTGTNHNNDTYNVYGLGINVAAEVVLEGQMNHFASITSYADARQAMVDASDVIFGQNSFQSLQVANAWYAVGVGSNPGQVTLTSPDLVCRSGSTFTANNPPTGSTISWSVTPSLLEVYDGNTTATPSIRAITTSAAGLGTVTVNFTSNGYATAGPSNNVWVGSPKPGPIAIQMDAPPHRFTASIDDVPTANSYNWYLDGVLNTTYHGTSAIFNRVSPYCGNWYGVEVEEINDCGTSAKTSGLAVEPDCLYLLQLTPNPTGTESTVELVSESGTDIDPNVAWDMEVYDPGQLLKEKQSGVKGKSTKLNASNWKEGVYIVRANYSGNVLTNKLVVKH